MESVFQQRWLLSAENHSLADTSDRYNGPQLFVIL